MRPTRLSRSAALAASALLAGTTALAACGGERPSGRPDPALERDLTLATTPPPPPVGPIGGDTAVTTPAPAPVAEPAPAPRPAPTARERTVREPTRVAEREVEPPAPRPTPRARPRAPEQVAEAAAPEPVPAPAAVEAEAPAAAGRGRGLAAGTVLDASLEQRVCTESNRPGDRLVATLRSDVAGPGGAVLPAGSAVVLEVARVSGSGDEGAVELVARGVTVRGEFTPIVAEVGPVTGQMQRRQLEKPANQDRNRVVGGAVAGAILGQVLGRGTKGTVIGAAAGAAAGAATAAAGTKYESCLVPGAPVRIRLIDAVAVR